MDHLEPNSYVVDTRYSLAYWFAGDTFNDINPCDAVEY